MSDSIVSFTELIAAAHCVVVLVVLHVAEPGQALCGIQYDKSHGSLIEKDQCNCKHYRLTKHRLMHTHESTLYTQHVFCIQTVEDAPDNEVVLARCTFACRKAF